MAYSKEVKENVVKRIEGGESVLAVSNDTGVAMATIYRWRENENKEIESAEKKASKEIKELTEQGKLEEAIKKCEEFPENPVIQSQHVSVLIKIGTKESLQEAIEICKKFLQNEDISMKQKEIFERQYERAQSKKIGIFVKEEDYEEARKACEEFLLESLVIQTQHVNVLIKIETKESLEEATEICKKCLQNEEISMERRETFQRQYERAQSKKNKHIRKRRRL